jgi:hypothetical protein
MACVRHIGAIVARQVLISTVESRNPRIPFPPIDLVHAADVVGVVVGRDGVIERSKTSVLSGAVEEFGNRVMAATPVASVDQDRASVWRNDQSRIARIYVEVVDVDARGHGLRRRPNGDQRKRHNRVAQTAGYDVFDHAASPRK